MLALWDCSDCDCVMLSKREEASEVAPTTLSGLTQVPAYNTIGAEVVGRANFWRDPSHIGVAIVTSFLS